MTIQDRDVINKIDSYLNPDPVDLIDGYLEKNFQVEPIMTEGGTAQVPEAFFKEFDIIKVICDLLFLTTISFL